jgi:hypothetical protein
MARQMAYTVVLMLATCLALSPGASLAETQGAPGACPNATNGENAPLHKVPAALLVPSASAHVGRGIARQQSLAKAIRVRVSASVRCAVPGRGGTQTVYIRVTDAFGRGLAGASVRVVVRGRGGARWLWAPATSASGYTSCSFPVGNVPAGYTVLIEVTAQWQGSRGKACTSYVPWW